MVSKFWKGSAPLAATGLLMLVVLAGAVIGLAVDPRIITGAPAWLKPAKFAVSIAIYTFTLAWIFSLIPEWRRTRRIVGWTTAVDAGARDSAHQPAGVSRHDQPFQRGHAL